MGAPIRQQHLTRPRMPPAAGLAQAALVLAHGGNVGTMNEKDTDRSPVGRMRPSGERND